MPLHDASDAAPCDACTAECECPEAERLRSEVLSLREDVAMAQFSGEVAQSRLAALVTELHGERCVMLALIRELVCVVEAVQPESESERLRLRTLGDQASRLLVMAAAWAAPRPVDLTGAR